MKKYSLFEIQANAILDMPLKKLSTLERKKIEQEYKELIDQIHDLETLIKSPKKMRSVVEAELIEMKATYSDRRRTQIVSLQEGESLKSLLTTNDVTPAQEVWVGVTPEGLIARTHSDELPRVSGRQAGAGFPAVRHTDLLLDFGGHCGMSRKEIIDAQLNGELLAETLGLQSWCYRQAQRPFAEALAGLLVGLESQVPQVYARTTPPLIEKYGFTEEEVVFFRLHIVADQEHGELGYEILEQHATTPEVQESCVRLVREATMMRRLYLDGLYNKFLAQPRAQAAE
jgi:pyrroloquinoline quinone (PQQ) biosynthesis protein C